MNNQRMGQCTNFGNCKIANNKETVPMDQNGECPTCGLTLFEVPSSSRSLFIKGGIGFAALLILGVGWYFSHSPSCGPNEIKTPTGECQPIIGEQVKGIQTRIEGIQTKVGEVPLLDLTVELEEIQTDIKTVQKQIDNSPNNAEIMALQTKIDEQKKRIEQIYNALVENIQTQIDDIEGEVGKTPVLSSTAKLEDVQKQIEAVRALISNHLDYQQMSELLQTQLDEQQTRIAQIDSSLVEVIQKQLANIREQIDNISERRSLTPKLEALQKQLDAVQEQIASRTGGTEITALQQRINELHKEIADLIMVTVTEDLPMCLSTASPEMQKRLPMFFVLAVQGRNIPNYLQDWMKGVAHVPINEPTFFIMRREVTVGEFQHYVDTLDTQQKDKLGKAWRQNKKNPVASVPWWAAKEYADWLAKKTGCPLTLPTYNQWVAATIRHAKPKKAIVRDMRLELKPQQRKEKPKEVVDLLGNLREWSIDHQGQKQCAKGSHYLLGEDYKTWRDNISGEPICESSTLDTVGFRLVLQEKQ
ncbi:SUMF1/EgtB/PvdO family nonheme iron enzyme [Candidatus Parabeggiatoa sp. HSG14]|uniref:SUMF1/EgtB/PvdO family nonheme iron enzyme n=1 Tax=Candidatus Parabeggiatoa sp. HSG14 TaxID=3055593 RepID=UPI0025A8CC28|nr:SUMF1/EgtB/PvdO family nonheme iron enzyme [Thiotrichales bacterium HSG14]